WQSALLLRWAHDLEQFRDAEHIAHALSQIAVEITGDRNLRIEIQRRVFCQRCLDGFSESDLQTRCIGKIGGSGCWNGPIPNVVIDRNGLTWEKSWTIARRCRSSQRPAVRIVNHIPVVELVGQHEPGNRDEIRAESEIELIAELIAKVVAERVPVTGRGELVQPMGNDFIGLIDRSLKPELTAANLSGRFHRFSATDPR